ncbi:MAG TPA: hypothetical protein VFH95_15955 [Candidatus Kapabacteria bacterium]|nr:hypothetical protein [Candidatus Kapabacteria bacterium]
MFPKWLLAIGLFAAALFTHASLSRAQINPVPDSSFEVWADGVPAGWSISPGFIFSSNDAHTGSFATAGTVGATGDNAPFLTTSFPLDYWPNMLDGYYRLISDSGDEIMVFAVISDLGVPIGQAIFVDSESSQGYRHFSVPFLYPEYNPNDSATILIEMENPTGKIHKGSSFIVDDIAFLGTAFDPFVSVHSVPTWKSTLSSYPNPFSLSTSISFTSEAQGYADVRVVNLLGAEVARLFSGELSAGEHEFSWDASGAAPGMYECVVWMNGEVRRTAMLLSK